MRDSQRALGSWSQGDHERSWESAARTGCAPEEALIPQDARIGLVLPSVIASGTERRIAFVYRNLVRRYPGQYRLIVSGDLYPVLNRGGFALDRLPGVHVFGPKPKLDRKRGADASRLVNLGRMATLVRYRRELGRLIEREEITLLQPYLELVPVLAIAQLRRIPWIVPLLDHQPKYFDGRSIDSRLLVRACRSSGRVDCLYRWIVERLESLGIPEELLFAPAWNCVNHEAFHPVEKDVNLVTFAARAIDLKNPMLMIDVIERVLRRRPDAHFAVLGQGERQVALAGEVARRGWISQVRIGYLEDPSTVVNQSLIHLSLERLDNATNQSLLEGLAAGCATVASDVGQTSQVVPPEVGVLRPLEAEPLAEAILGFLGDPSRALEMGRAARELALQRHHVDRYIDYLRLLHDLDQAGPVVGGIPTTAPG